MDELESSSLECISVAQDGQVKLQQCSESLDKPGLFQESILKSFL